MGQHYANRKRADDPHTLPDLETFFHQHAKRDLCALNAGDKVRLYGECVTDDEGDCMGTGWYYWSCLPGCMPDSEAIGPFETEREALADARSSEGDDDE